MTINGKTRDINRSDLLRCAEAMSLNHLKAEKIITEVNSSVKRWLQFANEAKVKEQQRREIEKLLSEVRRTLN